MPKRCVRDLEPGESIDDTFLVESSNLKLTRNGKSYIQFSLRDRTGRIRALLWEASREAFERIGADTLVRVVGRVEQYQGSLQLVVDSIETIERAESDRAEYLPHATADVAALERELGEVVAGVRSDPIRRFIETFLADPRIREGLRRAPAGKSLHHAYVGGLLEHIVTLARAARAIHPIYPEIDLDLLLAGVILHDLAKIEEISHDGAFAYTDRGQLVGHIAMGIAWVETKAREIPGIPKETVDQIQHMIASHHGCGEFGSPKEPMTAEAIALHMLDNLDAKLASYFAARAEPRNEAGPSQWSDIHPMFGRRLFFPPRDPGRR